jgi:hypothetical protein
MPDDFNHQVSSICTLRFVFSYIHKKVEMRFLDCSPSEQPGYIDEADRFYKNPQKWLNETFNKKQDLPSHIIFFDVLFKVSFDCQKILRFIL